jgi:CBS domain containing-hemolysin-like protein
MEIVPQLILIVLLVIINGYFVASEYALVAIRRTRIDELVKQGNSVARLVARALDNRVSYISATQLGNTIVGLILGWIGEPAVAGYLQLFFASFSKGFASFLAHGLSIVIAFVFITFLTIVIGELVPKTIALQKAETVSFIVIAPLSVFVRLFAPFISVLNRSSNLILRLFRFTPVSADQLILDQVKLKGNMPLDELEMVENAFRLGDLPVKQIMMPRTDVAAFDIDTTLKTLVKNIENGSYSRYPVYDGSIDNITGFIHVKDVYKSILRMEGDKKLSQTKLIRKIISVPETKKADEALFDMRRKHVHLAVVNDEFGGTEGIVTLEDIIENLVGEIQDEFDKPVKEIQRQLGGTYLIDGRTSPEVVQRKFHMPIKGQGYATMGGFIFGLLGREPHKNDRLQIGNIVFEVEEIDGKRIKTIQARREKKTN